MEVADSLAVLVFGCISEHETFLSQLALAVLVLAAVASSCGRGTSQLTVQTKRMSPDGRVQVCLSSSMNQCHSPTAKDLPCTLHKRDSSAQNASGLPKSPENLPRGCQQPPSDMGHRAWPHLCQSQLFPLPAGRRKRRKKGREGGREREGGKEGGCIWQLPPAARARAADSHSGRDSQCPQQLPPPLCPVA